MSNNMSKNMSNNMSKDDLITELQNSNIIKYGNFTLKSGKESKIYVNIKEINNYHHLLSISCELLFNEYRDILKDCNICGVPYGGIPFATLLANLNKCGIILLRKESKKHGLKSMVEGFKDKEIIIIEDVVTTGSSLVESCKILEENGYKIKHIFSILYRGDNDNITEINNYPYNYLLKLNDILDSKV